MLISWLLLLVTNVCHCYDTHYDTILFNTKQDIRLISSQKPKKNTIIIKDLQGATAISYVHNGSLLCWADETLEEIDCASFNGNGSATDRSTYAKGGVRSPDGIACDWLTKKLYWTDKDAGRIEVVSLETKYRKVLFWEDLDQPRGIAVDPLVGLMFWTDWGEVPKIERASMNGNLSTRKIIINEQIFWPNSVSLDIESKKMYWIDGNLNYIGVSDYNGGKRTELVKHGIYYPHALSVAVDKIYWTDWRTFSIRSVDRQGNHSPNEVTHLSAKIPINDIEIYDSIYQPYMSTPCEQNNGGCSHLCLLSSEPVHYSCACPTGIKLLHNNKTCASQIESFILLVQRTEIGLISLDTSDHSYTKLNLRGIKHSNGIDYDPVEETFYWTDLDSRSIRHAKLDGTQQQTVASIDVIHPDGIAIDWTARNIYWCDADGNRIEVARMNTTYRKSIIFDDLRNPRALVVHPQQGWLFWSDWNDETPKIERSDLDGSNRLVLVRENMLWPNGLALDVKGKKLYFGDAKTDKIEVINMDGTDRSEVVVENLGHIFGLSFFDDKLYWTDWNRRSLESISIHSPKERNLILDQVTDLMGVKAVNRYPPEGTSPCAENNGGCDQFCLNRPNSKYVCACQIEYELAADQKRCIEPNSYLVLYSDSKVRRVSIETSSSEVLPLIGVEEIGAIDVSVTDQRLYWVDSSRHTINRAYLNGSRSEKIVSFGVYSPESLAVDWLSSNLYWIDAGIRRIEVVKLNGLFRRTLFWNDLKEPRNLVLNPPHGHMFWSEWDGNSGSIMRGSMDGSSRTPIVAQTNRVHVLTMDYLQNSLYWTRSASDQSVVEFCDSNGRNRRTVAWLQAHPHSFALNQDHFFWTQWNDSSVMQMPRNHDSIRRTLYTRSSRVSHLRMVDSTKRGSRNQCSHNNGDCKYLCLVRPGSSSHSTEKQCVCPTHHVMMADGVCHPPSSFLLYSLRGSVHRLITSTEDCPDSQLALSGVRNVRAIEYDSSTKHVYWIESKLSVIKRGMANGSQSVTLVNVSQDEDQHSNIFDVAFEPFSKLLFWTCSAFNRINVTRTDNSSVGCIFEGKNGEKPRNLALLPEKGVIFWTDAGVAPRIVQARLDGDSQVTIDTKGQIVDSVAVDRRSNLLYFSYGGRIFEYNLVKRQQRLLFTISMRAISNLAAIESSIYWLNREMQRIERIDVGGGGRTTVVDLIAPATDLIAIEALPNTHSLHPCSSAFNHGNCSHLCLPSTEGADKVECGCPQDLELSDNRQTCVSPVSNSLDQITCKLEKSNLVCDGKADCPDGSDESYCCTPEYSGVGIAYFQCKTLTCIPQAHICDGHDHCADGSDESPGLCGNIRAPIKTESYVEDNRNIQFVTAFVFVLCLAVFGLSYVYFKRRCKDSSVSNHDVAAMRPITNGLGPLIMSTKSLSQVNIDSTSGSYERTLVSSSTSMIHCPLNPPPSPTTTTMQQDECCCSLYEGSTPTPCSTDVCGESDSTLAYRSDDMYMCYQNGSSGSVAYKRRIPDWTHRHRPRRQPRHQRPNYDYQEVPYSPYRSDGTDYELAPPHPTPYTSDAPSSPPSSVYSRSSTIPPPPPTPNYFVPDHSN